MILLPAEHVVFCETPFPATVGPAPELLTTSYPLMQLVQTPPISRFVVVAFPIDTPPRKLDVAVVDVAPKYGAKICEEYIPFEIELVELLLIVTAPVKFINAPQLYV